MDLQAGWIRYSTNAASAFLNYADPQAPSGAGHAFLRDPRLATEYVLDAHRIQVVTGRHLRKARNLDAWLVEEVVGDRYLIRARDLEPWFAETTPAQLTSAQAREDFGALLPPPEILS